MAPTVPTTTKDPKPVYINSVVSFLDAIAAYPSNDKDSWIYRGQGDADWPLRPKAGRPEFFNSFYRAQSQHPHTADSCDKSHHRDLVLFAQWREQAIAFDRHLPESDLECLAYAQHYGLATRLLDWTTNALVALYFAVEDLDETKEGAVFVHLPWAAASIDTKLKDITEVQAVHVRPFDKRLGSQSGCFTYHPFPNQEFVPPPLYLNKKKKIRINYFNVIRFIGGKKRLMKQELAKLGFNGKTIYPDLTGLGQFINWKMETEAYYKDRGGR